MKKDLIWGSPLQGSEELVGDIIYDSPSLEGGTEV